MNGPEHYAEAERLIANARRALEGATENTFNEVLASSAPILAEAQVHAALALVAAPTAPERAWIVRAEWVNSSPTYHGPFAYAEQAEDWAADHVALDGACDRHEIGILSPAVSS